MTRQGRHAAATADAQTQADAQSQATCTGHCRVDVFAECPRHWPGAYARTVARHRGGVR